MRQFRISKLEFRIAPTAILAAALALSVLAEPHAAQAQMEKAPRVGMLLSGAAPSPGQPSFLLDAFCGGLRDLGYVEGQNLVIEYR